MAEMSDRELNKHMDQYERVPFLHEKKKQGLIMELRLVTPLFQFYIRVDLLFRVDLRVLFFTFVFYNYGRHLGGALFSS